MKSFFRHVLKFLTLFVGIAASGILLVPAGALVVLISFIPASNEPSAVLARAFGECREGQYPAACGVANLMPRCLRRGC